MVTSMARTQDYYLDHGSLGAPEISAAGLPHDLGELCRVVQGFLIHRDLAAPFYETKLSPQARDLANMRSVGTILAKVQQDQRPLTEARDPAARLPCVCLHFSTVLAALLREQGVPARARCGFGTYFTPGRFEDHWVAEYWNEDAGRWILVDAQLDAAQVKIFKPDFNPLDVPRNRFILAGDAWLMCREGRADENKFGLSFLNEQGLWWIAANLIRDVASLNRVPMLPWDVWGMMREPGQTYDVAEAALLDRVAKLTLAGDAALPELIEIYQDPRFAVPGSVFNADRKISEPVWPAPA